MHLRMISNDCRSSRRVSAQEKVANQNANWNRCCLERHPWLTTGHAACWALGFGVLSSVDGHRVLRIPTRSGAHSTAQSLL